MIVESIPTTPPSGFRSTKTFTVSWLIDACCCPCPSPLLQLFARLLMCCFCFVLVCHRLTCASKVYVWWRWRCLFPVIFWPTHPQLVDVIFTGAVSVRDFAGIVARCVSREGGLHV